MGGKALLNPRLAQQESGRAGKFSVLARSFQNAGLAAITRVRARIPTIINTPDGLHVAIVK
jgi:hypothetical protein